MKISPFCLSYFGRKTNLTRDKENQTLFLKEENKVTCKTICATRRRKKSQKAFWKSLQLKIMQEEIGF